MALKTVVLESGECTVLPADVRIISLTADGSITATSSCGTLPTPGVYKCWRFVWEDMSDDDGFNDAFFTGIKIGSTTYNLVGAPVSEVNTYDNGGEFLPQAIPVSTPPGLVTDITTAGGEAQNPKCITLNIPDSLPQPIIYWDNPTLGGFIQHSAFFGEEDQCSCEGA